MPGFLKEYWLLLVGDLISIATTAAPPGVVQPMHEGRAGKKDNIAHSLFSS